jgi:hypothetical protein
MLRNAQHLACVARVTILTISSEMLRFAQHDVLF